MSQQTNKGKKCCQKCYTNYTSDDYPSEFYDACYNPKCKCHECDNSCGFVEPYGFVPEADCPIHDPKIEKGIDYTKDNIYDGIGRPDLKPVNPTPKPTLSNFIEKKYQIVYADPAWSYSDKRKGTLGGGRKSLQNNAY